MVQATVAMVQAELEENYSDFRLHTLCEELGATYVKLGQFIASSPTR